MLCSALSASAMIALRSRSSAVTDWTSLSEALKVLTLSSDSTRLIRSRASMVRVSTVPPPSSRSDRALRWLRITGTSPLWTVLLSKGLDGAPAVIWM